MSKFKAAVIYTAMTILFSLSHFSCSTSAQSQYTPPVISEVSDTLVVVDNGQVLHQNGAIIVDAATVMSEASGVNEQGKRVIDSVAAEITVMTYEIQQTSLLCKDKLRQIKNLENNLDNTLSELKNLQARAGRKVKDTKYALND